MYVVKIGETRHCFIVSSFFRFEVTWYSREHVLNIGMNNADVTYGLSGCYMPDSNSGPMQFDTRKELASFIRNELEYFEMPATLFREVRIRRLWGYITRHGSSSAHFSLDHKGNSLTFHGLTEAEYSAG